MNETQQKLLLEAAAVVKANEFTVDDLPSAFQEDPAGYLDDLATRLVNAAEIEKTGPVPTALTAWVLTVEYNLYDQEGEYFCAVFGTKPTSSRLIAAGVAPKDVEHVLAGGGRIDVEERWFFLREYPL